MDLTDKQAAKRIIKIAKKHPEMYSQSDLYYAKMVKKRIKQQKKNEKKAHNRKEDPST